MKKIVLAILMLVTFFSCSNKNDVKEEVLTRHTDGPIVDVKRNGVFETYYKSGSLMSKGTFVNGVREGEAFTYYENGNVKYQGFYDNGKECGIWKFYDENGDLDKEVNRDLR